MDCKEFERLIPDFITKKLDFQTLMKFSEHMEACAECKEELVIQLLVSEGMQRLEEGSAFDLQREFEERVAEARHKIKFHRRFLEIGAFFETLVVIMLTGIIIWLLH